MAVLQGRARQAFDRVLLVVSILCGVSYLLAPFFLKEEGKRKNASTRFPIENCWVFYDHAVKLQCRYKFSNWELLLYLYFSLSVYAPVWIISDV
jgi:hypothetical protein